MREIEMKKTIIINDEEKSCLLPLILDSWLQSKSKFYKMFKEQS